MNRNAEQQIDREPLRCSCDLFVPPIKYRTMQFLGKMVHLRHFFKILDYFCILLPKQKIYFCEQLINSTILYSLHKKYIIKNGSNVVKSLSSVKY